MGSCVSQSHGGELRGSLSPPWKGDVPARESAASKTAELIIPQAPSPTQHSSLVGAGRQGSRLRSGISSLNSPIPNSLTISSGSEDGPFTGYNPAAWGGHFYNSDEWRTRRNTSPNKASPTSTSVLVLEQISKKRASQRSTGADDRAGDYSPQSTELRLSAETTRKSLSARTRRFSSRFNSVNMQMEALLPRIEEEARSTYLQRLFKLLDTGRRDSVPITTIVNALFKGGCGESVARTLSFEDTDADGRINAAEFVKFFAHLSSDNCVGPEADLGGTGALGLSGADTADNVGSDVDCRRSTSSSNSATDAPTSSRGMTESLLPPHASCARIRDIVVETLPGQSERIKCLALCSSPKLYAISHRHDSVAHIHTHDGAEVRRLVGHGDSLLGIAFSPDRKYIATVSRDRLLVLWDCTVGLECHSVEHPGIVTAVTFAFDGRSIYTGCQDNVTRRIGVPRGVLRATIPDLPHAEKGVTMTVAAQHTKNDLVVFSRSCDDHAYVAQAHNLNLCMQLNGHDTLIWQSTFSGDDTLILTCCERRIIVWNVEDFSPVGDFDASLSKVPCDANDCLWTTAVFGSSYHHDRLIFAFNTQNEALVLDVDAPEEESVVMDLKFKSSVYAAASADGSDHVVCGDDLGNVYRLTVK